MTTQHSGPQVATQQPPSEGLIVLGYIAAVLLPPVGFAIGCIVTAKGKTTPGVVTLVLSSVVFLLAVARYS